jgi:hypothetical protein
LRRRNEQAMDEASARIDEILRRNR